MSTFFLNFLRFLQAAKIKSHFFSTDFFISNPLTILKPVYALANYNILFNAYYIYAIIFIVIIVNNSAVFIIVANCNCCCCCYNCFLPKCFHFLSRMNFWIRKTETVKLPGWHRSLWNVACVFLLAPMF